MDCEKFETHVIDALYDELDEVTHAAMKRHMDGCSRCSSLMTGLRATREVGVLPIEEPSDDLEERILASAAAIQKKAPWHRKVVRGIAWAGSHAMRPQLAMAAVLVLMLGSSLLLLRAKPGTVGVAPIRVTERGVPEPDQGESFAASPPPPAAMQAQAAATAMPTTIAPAQELEQELDRKRVAEKAKEEGDKDGAVAGAKEGKDATDALAEARATKGRSGCEAAVGKYDDVGSRFPRTPSAAAAMWEAAECYKSMGDGGKAREIFMALRSVDGYQKKADDEIASTDVSNANAYNQNQQQSGSAPGGGQAAAARAAAAPPAAPKPKAAMEAAEAQYPPAAAPPPPPSATAASRGGSTPAGQGARNAAPAKSHAEKRAVDAY
jgi:Putative zinc-finger